MSYLKKLIAMVLSILMLCNVVMPVMAATNTEGVTFTATIETPTIEVSDKDQTVVVKITTNKEVVYDSYEADVYIPDGFAIAELKNTVATFEEDSDYFGNLIVYCTANAQNLTTDNLLTITYTIPANTPAGEYDLGVYFWIIGRDWCSDIWEEGAEVTATLTIKDAAPACTHESTKAVSNGNGTHNIVCTNTECGAAVEENVSCTGGTADCETLAQCQYCKASYGSYGGHNYGNLIPAKDAVHTETEQKAGVAAHYQCSVCEKYFDADKNETTYEALAGETPVHSVDPTKTTTETPKAPTCTEEGTEETKYFCSCGKLLRTETKSLPVDGTAHTWGEPSYDWSDDGKTCTATRTCEKDHTHKETVTTTNITSQEIQGVTCSTAGQIEYTATFEEDWAGTDTETLEIPAYHNNNMEYHPFKDAVDCATPGNIEYWYCPGCDACFGDAYAEEYLPYGYIEITLDCERPDDVADCADVTCEICGETIYGYGEHDVLACKGGTCSKCKEEIEGYGCQNYDTPACEDGVCYYCGGFVAGFGHENGAWADCLDGECAYGCGLVYPATVPHVDEDSDDYCDNCWNHLNHVAPDEDEYDPCVGYDCQICWAWVDGQHTGELVYTNNGENHVSYYSCCQTKEEGTTEGHTYDATTHKCICGATNHAHDHYETTETTHQSVCSCGEVLGEAVDHVDGEVLFAGNCQGNAWYKCTVCGENSKGDVNPANHATTATRYTNITATHHTLVHACCGEPIETVAHNKDNYAFEGNCQIPAHYECSCGKEYDGEVNPNVHAAGSTVWYKDITDEQHTAYHPCCQTEIETVNHTYDAENHKCVCGEVERFTLTVNVLVTYDDVELTVPYGANILEVLAQAVADSKIPALNTPVRINLEGDRIGEGTPSGYTYFISEELGYEDVDEDFTMPAGDFVIVQDYYIFTGWDIFDDNYAYVNENDCIEAGWHYIEEDYDDVDGGAWYYFQYDESYGLNFRAEDITLTTKDDVEGYYAFDHETGKWLENYTGIYTADNGDIYYVENGIAVANKGLVRVVLDDGHVHYYYFGCSVTDSDSHADNSCNAYLAQKNGTHWVENNNGYLVKWDYTFDENGVIVHDEDTSKNGVHKDNGVKFYYIDGVKVHFGLFIGEDGGYYYARSNGSLVVDRTYWISESHLNGVVRNGEPVKEGSYTFDAEGRIVWPDETKDGVFAEDGGLFYYVNGVRDYAGLISYTGSLTTEDGTVIENAYEDAWIYVRTSGELVVGRSYWVTKNNGLVKSATYNFDAEGKMIRTNGFVHEAGGIYYYVNGSRYHAGLIKVDGDYYYVKTSGQVVTGCRYWITHTNGYDVKEGSYEFDADGKMIIPEPVPEKNGIVEENGKLFYYENGKLTYAGLIQYTGDLTTEDGTVIKNAYKNAWIYVRTNGELVVGRSYWITKNNGNMLSGNYTFDEEGVMKNPTA